MVIWSSVERERELSQGQYFCPHCGDFRSYKEKSVSKFLIFCYVPLFEIQKLSTFVECQACQKSFDPAVLESFRQILFRLSAEFPDERLQHSSPWHIRTKLIERGAPEDLADKIITMAQTRSADTCRKPIYDGPAWDDGNRVLAQT